MRPAQHIHASVGAAPRGRPQGFTLVELLVALTIFITVMASVALVFNGAVRSSKQGFQNQEAFELARGTMKLIERDLSRAFTNRDHGDVFNFYGTPIGFTYVGLIAADESSTPNMARVTYVMYHDQFQTVAGATEIYESKEGLQVPTYYLLRFIEPGADTLDSLPLDFSQAVYLDGSSPVTYNDVVQATVQQAGCPNGDQGCIDLVTRSARREIWIKMLSGGGGDAVPAVNPGGFETAIVLPSAWSVPRDYLGITDFQPGQILTVEEERNLVRDYVVAEHIRSLRASDESCGATSADVEGLIAPGAYFESIYQNTLSEYCVVPLTDANVPPYFPHFEFGDTATYSLAGDLRPFFTYWDIGVIRSNSNMPAYDQHTPVAYQFWNDPRNLADGLDNDGDNNAPQRDLIDNDNDGLVDEPDEVVDMNHNGLDDDNDGVPDDGDEGIDEADEVYGDNAGSPLDTRLPIAVTTDFTLFFRSPYPGAPDFNERFTQRIDLPTAYRRQFKNTVAMTP